MRIIGGRARGLKLADVGAGDPAAHLPAQVDGKRSLFSGKRKPQLVYLTQIRSCLWLRVNH